ncbi:phosphoglycerate mutase [Bizionia argentinensis JUB59]|uniref:Phosphoglycerate mutase n=1 Tax=Bizionia argentinensis JUB59 TaxID=1046627 RepID=G2EGR8_9FLAO|nr:phosphoglycerate mutase family protein [Bizionia argentinensis]EGV42426.1 phosphoglycerate mutase [Bizionia argentinensis JUB59]
MKFLVTFIFIGFLSLSSCSEKSDNKTLTTLYFIRHSEKDRSNPDNKNPHLTILGKERAQYWAEVLQHIKFDAIYTTNYNRTIETGAPTAKNNNLTVQFYNADKLDAEKMLIDNKGNNVLIVGHSDTTPKFVNKFLETNSYQEIDDSNNGNLYILTITDDIITDFLLTMNP